MFIHVLVYFVEAQWSIFFFFLIFMYSLRMYSLGAYLIYKQNQTDSENASQYSQQPGQSSQQPNQSSQPSIPNPPSTPPIIRTPPNQYNETSKNSSPTLPAPRTLSLPPYSPLSPRSPPSAWFPSSALTPPKPLAADCSPRRTLRWPASSPREGTAQNNGYPLRGNHSRGRAGDSVSRRRWIIPLVKGGSVWEGSWGLGACRWRGGRGWRRWGRWRGWVLGWWYHWMLSWCLEWCLVRRFSFFLSFSSRKNRERVESKCVVVGELSRWWRSWDE